MNDKVIKVVAVIMLIATVLGQTAEEYCCYCEKGFEQMGK